MSVIVKQSTVSDGSMYNRNNKNDASVFENRASFIASLEKNASDFVHLLPTFDTEDFCRYVKVDTTHRGRGMADQNTITADAIITTTPGLGLFLPLADCIGAVLYDETENVLALAHFGRHSLEQNGIVSIVNYLNKHHTVKAKNLRVWMTAAAGKDVYQIWKLDNQGMKDAAFAQLEKAGVPRKNIDDNPAETTSDPNYYSYSEFLKGSRTDDGDHAVFAIMN
jgi:copper oxidase (laccase) domain-containing protein